MTYEDAYGDFGPIRMTPQEIHEMYAALALQNGENK